MVVRLIAPDGAPLDVSEPGESEAPEETDRSALRERFLDEGFIVLRGLLPDELRLRMLEACDAELRPFDGGLLRVKPPSPAPHERAPSGHVRNALRSVHRIEDPSLGGFVACVDAISGHAPLVAWVELLLDGGSEVFESFFFDVNNATEAHRDTDYSGVPVIGAWCALVDVPARAGRFFLYPRSHRGTERDARAVQGADYGAQLLDEMRRRDLRCVAPSVRAGDVVLFDGSLVHGSLASPGLAIRQVLTIHFAARSSDIPVPSMGG